MSYKSSRGFGESMIQKKENSSQPLKPLWLYHVDGVKGNFLSAEMWASSLS